MTPAPSGRDAVWDAALRLARDRPEIRLRDVQHELEADVSERTIRRTLNAMEELGWLDREAEGSHYWRAGPKLRE